MKYPIGIRTCSQLLIEKAYSRSRVDCILETRGYVYNFEFKLDGTAGDAQPYLTDSPPLKE